MDLEWTGLELDLGIGLGLVNNFVSTNNGVVISFIRDQGAPAVSLARVLSSICSTDHVGGDLRGGVGGVRARALGVGHGVHINLGR